MEALSRIVVIELTGRVPACTALAYRSIPWRSMRSRDGRAKRLEIRLPANGCRMYVNANAPEEPQMKAGMREEDRQTEDDVARGKLGPRGVPGAPDTAKMTPQEDINIPKSGEFDGHAA